MSLRNLLRNSSFLALEKNQIRMWDNVMKNGGWKSSDFIGVPEFKGKTWELSDMVILANALEKSVVGSV